MPISNTKGSATLDPDEVEEHPLDVAVEHAFQVSTLSSSVVKAFLFAILLYISAATSVAQQIGGSGVPGTSNSGTSTFNGVPTGNCSSAQTAVDTTTGNYYSCNNGTWQKVGPGAGGAPSGTAGGSLAGNYPNPSLAAQAANTLLGNNTGSSAAPAALTISQVASLLGLGTAANQPSSAFDASGAASAVQSASLQKSTNLSDLASASTARTNLGLGTAAIQAASAFDASGAATTAQANAIAASAPSACTNGSYACSASPALTGTPTAPTQAISTNNTDIATTAAVSAAIAGLGGGTVSSVFTRTGAVTAASGDYTVSQVTGAAPLASPALTGTPTAPTQAISTNNTDIATTAAVTAALAGLSGGGVSSVFTRTGAVTSATGDYTVSQVTGAAPLASPNLTGTPTAPTQAISTNNTDLATTAAVQSAINALSFPVNSVFGRTGTVTANSGDYSVGQVTGAAPLASPALTGTPTAPTQAISTNNTDIATTAAVTAGLASSRIVNGISYSAAYPQSTLSGRINACMADAENLSNGNTSGKCSSEGEAQTQTDSSGTTISIGSASGLYATWIHPTICYWSFSGFTGGTADVMVEYGGSAIVGDSPGNPTCEINSTSAANGARAIFETLPSTIASTNNLYFRVQGLAFFNRATALNSGASWVVNSTNDGSLFEDILAVNYEGPTQSAILLNNTDSNYGQCCATTFNRIVAAGNYTSGPVLKILNAGAFAQSAIAFTNSSFGHPGAGYPVISCSGGNTNGESIQFDNIYEEGNNSDTTTAFNQFNGCIGLKFNGLTMQAQVSGSTAPGIQLNGTLQTSVDLSRLTMAHNFTQAAIAVQDNVTGSSCASTPCNVLTDSNGNLSHYVNGVLQAGLINATAGFQIAGAPLSSVFAPLASPVLTGTPTAPTPALSTNNGSIETTGGVTAALAGYASSGANSSITSLSGLTTPLTVSQGGIGSATAGAKTVFGNFTGASAAPGFSAAPVFSAAGLTNFPTLNQNTTGSAGTVPWTGVTGGGANAVTTATSTAAPWTFSAAGAASQATLDVTGSWYTGGSATTNWGALTIAPTGGTFTGLSTAGTGLLMGNPNGGTGNFIDLHSYNGGSLFSVNYQGFTTIASGLTLTAGNFTAKGLAASNTSYYSQNLTAATSGVCGSGGAFNWATNYWNGTASTANTTSLSQTCAPGTNGTETITLANSVGAVPLVFAVTGQSKASTYATITACSSSASPAVCSASPSGFVAVPAAGTTLLVNTTAVTANSQITLTFDSSLGAALGVTCNTTINQPSVSARTAGTSFTITMSGSIATNPDCLSYAIIN